jgi:hypothetical protein
VKEFRGLVGGLIFATFVAGKVAGTYIAMWSWWWLLMPVVPVIAAVIKGQF